MQMPGLHVPCQMQNMNYGCGTTVHPAEITGEPTVLYIGVGGGLEALQFAYFSRRPEAVIAVDPVASMRSAAQQNLLAAAEKNDWFDASFVSIREGDAFKLPMPDNSVDVVAQNCLFNIFEPEDLKKALSEAYRVLKPNGRLVMSDPISTREIPEHLRDDDRLRAMCLSGALTYENYVQQIIDAGFGQVEVRTRRPYRLLNAKNYQIDQHLMLESLDCVSFKVPIADDGACVFTGKMAVYAGEQDYFDDNAGHILQPGVPLAVCDKTARNLEKFEDIVVTDSTWHYDGGGCC